MATKENEDLKKLVNNLAKTINLALAQSPVVRQAVEAIRKKGYELDLSLAACIGIYKNDHHAKGEKCPAKNICQQEIKFEFDQNDVEFLKSINVRLSKE